MSAPPTYDEAQQGRAPPPADGLSIAIDDHKLDYIHDPDPETCLAHLRLLSAFQNMKEDIGYTDGLWGIWNSRADGNIQVTPEGEILEDISVAADTMGHKEKELILSKIREKRWALFVARAVDRYEAWWNALVGSGPLREEYMDEEDTMNYTGFPSTDGSRFWADRNQPLPPLDVLMVYHSHMLNPHNFLEDCLRAGYSDSWAAGMPWKRVNNAIGPNFAYDVSDDDKARWVALTNRSWDNIHESMSKSLDCPTCRYPLSIPWTTCNLDEMPKTEHRSGLIGSGYGDGKLDYQCHKCTVRINKELLSVAKFCKDSRDLLVNNVPMPGTILNPATGRPDKWHRSYRQRWNYRTFPNRMIKLVLRIKIQELLKYPDLNNQPTMDTVRKMVEEVLGSVSSLRIIFEGTHDIKSMRKTEPAPVSKICLRKMMNRYWENFSPFAIDLCGAVMRQGIFSEKMQKIDWLHSPAAYETMGRLCKKYERFLFIMAIHPEKTAVPTLDVDLAWHTHQLSSSAYYEYTTKLMGVYVRHDDKIDETKLGDGFEWMSRVYQEKYQEVYSECTCWYCEAVRASHVSSVGKVLGVSKNEKVAENFYKSGAANLCPPHNSAHISAHNAVKTVDNNSSLPFAQVQKRLRDMHEKRLEENYEKACRRAAKKGRELPPKNQYYEHWGYSYYMYGPWMYPLYFTPGMYYGWDPGYSASGGAEGTQNWAACATGSCGGDVAAGNCGGIGGCAAGNMVPGGMCGGSGGGCGGGSGGGGGCGGGGGGGGCGGGGGGGC